MKKIISTILTITMLLSVIYPCQSVIANETELSSILCAGQELSQMCAEYDGKIAENPDTDGIINTRIIVKTDNKAINEYGAVNSVYGFGYAFFAV